MWIKKKNPHFKTVDSYCSTVSVPTLSLEITSFNSRLSCLLIFIPLQQRRCTLISKNTRSVLVSPARCECGRTSTDFQEVQLHFAVQLHFQQLPVSSASVQQAERRCLLGFVQEVWWWWLELAAYSYIYGIITKNSSNVFIWSLLTSRGFRQSMCLFAVTHLPEGLRKTSFFNVLLDLLSINWTAISQLVLLPLLNCCLSRLWGSWMS